MGKKMETVNLLSKEWRIDNLYMIVDKNSDRIKFKRNKAQRHYAANRTNRNIILKARQLGFTTDECVDILDEVLFTPNYSALLIAHTYEEAQKIFKKKVSFAWENIEERVSVMWKVITDSANQLKFDFQDGTYSNIVVSNSGRSGTNNRVHVSEFAKLCSKFPLKADEVVSGTFPSVPIDGRIDIESTAEGMSGHFYDMFITAYKRKTKPEDYDYTAHFYNWTWDEEEMKKVRKIISPENMEQGDKFKAYQNTHKLSDLELTYYYIKWIGLNKKWETLQQEYPTTPEEAFVTSGRPAFDTDICYQNLRISEKISPEIFDLEITREGGKITGVNKIITEQGYFRQYVKNLEIIPQRDKNRFAVGTDVAEGLLQGDYSSMDILDRVYLNYPLKWHGHIDPDLLAWEQLKLQIYLKGCAYFCTELNNHGFTTVTTARDLGIKQYKRENYAKGYEENKDTGLGFKTTVVTRPIIVGYLKEAIRSESFVDWDVNFWRETLTFVRNEHGKEEADGKSKNPGVKCYDDRIFSKALSLACHNWMPPLVNEYEKIKTRLMEEYKKKRKNMVT